MRKDNNTGKVPSRPQREPSFEEPIRHWVNLPISQDRARELVDLITRREDRDALDALMELICGVMPNIPSDNTEILDERFLAGHAALWHAFKDTTRASNGLGAYVVGLKCAAWE
jgi:hypothetical protein